MWSFSLSSRYRNYENRSRDTRALRNVDIKVYDGAKRIVAKMKT